jgi:hypothetical protein
VHGYPDGAAQIQAIAGHIRVLRDDGASEAGICLVLPTNRAFDRWEQILAGDGIAIRRVQRRAADDPAAPGVRLATMHRVQGLQFDHVILPDLDAGRFPAPQNPSLAQFTDDVERWRYLDRCRSLLFVALTRAELSAYVTFVGGCTALLPSLDRPVEDGAERAGGIGSRSANPSEKSVRGQESSLREPHHLMHRVF